MHIGVTLVAFYHAAHPFYKSGVDLLFNLQNFVRDFLRLFPLSPLCKFPCLAEKGGLVKFTGKSFLAIISSMMLSFSCPL